MKRERLLEPKHLSQDVSSDVRGEEGGGVNVDQHDEMWAQNPRAGKVRLIGSL